MCHNAMQPFTKFQFWAVHGTLREFTRQSVCELQELTNLGDVNSAKRGLDELVKCDADLIKQNEWSS
jgi:hypothetical protein